MAAVNASLAHAVSATALASSASISSTASVSQSRIACAAPRLPTLAVRCEQSTTEAVDVSRRGFSMAAAALVLGAVTPAVIPAPAVALLDADDDAELLERIKRERKEKIELRESRGSYKNEEADIQAAVYGLSKVGQALEAGDLSGASAALGSGWLAKADAAIAKISVSDGEKDLAAVFQSSTGAITSAVSASDIVGAKRAFLASALALEGWAKQAGLAGELKGL
eukprot:TRINITY_DN75623_c0_g1_i1.p1 TRINITY_DN75623_c0_g1~~TRINITY_DN75623_c0_g1_i1.p1  ORF type:complete len:251 (+),score=18.09 TRINITY_DN75623_c0_g1_i1:80-754(+)